MNDTNDSVTFYRDDTYGGLAICQEGNSRVITTVDHGLCESDFEALLGILESRASGKEIRQGVWEWALKAHPMEVMASIGGVMRRQGYGDDKLGAKTISKLAPMSEGPDLPAAGLMEVRCAAVKVGLLALASLVEKAAGMKESQLSVGVHPRPNALGIFNEPLPFLRIQVEGKALDPSTVQQGVRQVFSQHEGVVRLTAEHAEKGYVRVEAAFSLPQHVLETYERRTLPTFPNPGRGLVREARFSLPKPLPEDVVEDLRKRILESECGVEVTITERTFKVLMPCSQVQTHALSKRIRWVNEQLRAWGGDLAEVSELRESDAVNCSKE